MNVRIVAATNKDLEDEVRTNRFREYLYYRLNVVTIKMPPLRERRDDIPLLAHDFLEKMNAVESKLVKGFEDNVTEALMNYRWPGNVRELENIVERAYILCPNITLTKKYLPSMLTGDSNEQGVDEMSLRDREAPYHEGTQRYVLESGQGRRDTGDYPETIENENEKPGTAAGRHSSKRNSES